MERGGLENNGGNTAEWKSANETESSETFVDIVPEDLSREKKRSRIQFRGILFEKRHLIMPTSP